MLNFNFIKNYQRIPYPTPAIPVITETFGDIGFPVFQRNRLHAKAFALLFPFVLAAIRQAFIHLVRCFELLIIMANFSYL